MKNAIIEEIAGNWEVMAAMEDAAHPARRATFRECADLLRSMAASDKSGEHEQQLEELVRSACAIADRRGAETAWDRFTASAKSLGLNGVTARTYRILPSDEPVQEAEQAATADGAVINEGAMPQPAAPAVMDAVELIVRDVYKLDYSAGEWDEEKMLAIQVEDLRLICKRHIAAPAVTDAARDVLADDRYLNDDCDAPMRNGACTECGFGPCRRTQSKE